MKRAFTFLFTGLAMFFVALLAAFTSMRLAIHGREIDVPNLAGLSDEAAATAAHKLGLDLSIENRFYSAGVASNHVLSQSPAAGALVRRGSQVRVTESLGGQQVAIPDLLGQTERPASLVLRRLQLELGPTSHLPAPISEGLVVAQSPPANATGLVGPHVSLLVAEPESDAPMQSYVMPQITGMTLGDANARLGSAGLHISSAQEPAVVPPVNVPVDPTTDPAIPPTILPPVPPSPSAVITYQQPAPGHRVSRADSIRVTVAPVVDPVLGPAVPAVPQP